MTETPLIPRTLLFGNPERTMPSVSPDGSRLAFVSPVDGVLNLWVGRLDGGTAQPVTDDRDRGVRIYEWAHDDRHLLYLQDRDGDENWHLYTVDVTSGHTRDVTPFEGVQARLIKLSRRRPGQVLVALNRDNPAVHDVYCVDLDSGGVELVERNPGFTAMLGSWLADEDLMVRGGMRPRAEGGYELMVRDDDQSPWRSVMTIPLDESWGTRPLAFTGDGKRLLLLSSQGTNTSRLVTFDLVTDETTTLAEDPDYDVFGIVQHPTTAEPQIVTVRKQRLEHLVLDAALADDFARVRRLHHGDVDLVSRDHADRVWILRFDADQTPPVFYAYDRTTGQARRLFVSRPALEEYHLATMEPFCFTARDGLTIHGYLTFPVDVPRRALPTVLLVHGGPWFRDVWGFNPEAQWLANRGYLCVQVNYRGSTGYGKEFLNAGNRQWGGAMHHDLLDAVDWAVAAGFCDRDRVAIMGGSYGGYAALVGAAFTPEAFRCAVAQCGPSNLKTLIESAPPYWSDVVVEFRKRVGDPDVEPEFVWSRSPLSGVDNISIPLLIAQGATDPRVTVVESEQIVAAMRENGIPHEYLLFADEGHGFIKPQNELEFRAAVERFLATHLGGRAEPSPRIASIPRSARPGAGAPR